MGLNEIRTPIQKRSIEKRKKIIEAGFDLICKKGYYNTNTAEIAKYAGVSTGIVYQYFKDKHDILIEGIEKYASDIFYPMLKININKKIKKEELPIILKEMINKFIENHKLSQIAHEEITAMIHLDKEIASFFQKHEMYMTQKIASVLIENNFDTKNIYEKVHISMHIIDDICHEIVYHKHSELDYNQMTNIAINQITMMILYENKD